MPYDVVLSWQVKAAIRSLNPLELDRVNAALDRLRDGRLRELPQPYRIRESNGESPYVMRVDDSLRILFTLEQDRILVQDMVRRELAGRYG